LNSDSISWPNKRRTKVSYFFLLSSIGKLIFVGFRFAKNWLQQNELELKKVYIWEYVKGCHRFLPIWHLQSHFGNDHNGLPLYLEWSFFSNIFRYGPQLVRIDCTHYSPGTVIVVRRLKLFLIPYHLIEISDYYRYLLLVWYMISSE
jgi:hypothetical protein